MKVFVTGGTGFTGSYVVPRLLAAGVQVRCLVRDRGRAARLEAQGVELAAGDLGDPDGLARHMAGCDALLNIASMGFGHAPAVIAAAESNRLGRCVFTSTTAIFTQLNVGSKAARLAAEVAVRRSTLDWVIIRPTMIFGSGRDRNMCRLARFLAWSFVLPVFGRGDCLMQPVYVDDLAQALVAALLKSAASRQEYTVSGRQAHTYNEIVLETSRLMGKKVWMVHLPERFFVHLLKLLERTGLQLPLKSEQILRLNENKAFSWASAERDLGYEPRTFTAAMQFQLHGMGLLRETGPR